MVGVRLCLVVSGVVVLVGVDICYDLVEYIVGGFVDGFLVVELFVSFVEEILYWIILLFW